MALDWSNQQEVLKRRQQAIEAGYKPADVDSFITKKRNEQATMQLGQAGVADPAEIAKSDPQLALKLIQQGVQPKQSAEALKQDKTSQGVLGLVDELKFLYNQDTGTGSRPNQTKQSDLSAGGTGILAPVKGFLFDLQQVKTNKNVDAKTYKRLKEGFVASLKEATGDTGVLTDQDFARIAKALPDFGDSDDSARQAFTSIDRILQGKFGKVGKYSYLDQPKEEGLVPGYEASTVQGNPSPSPSPAFQRAQQNNQQRSSNPMDEIMKMIAFNPVSDAIVGAGDFLAPRVMDVAEKLGKGQKIGGGEVASAGVDLGLAALPIGKVKALANAGKGGKLLEGILRGAAPGAIYGATGAEEQTLGERAGKAVTGGAGSLLVGQALKLPGFTKDKIIGEPVKRINELFKVPTAALKEFAKHTGLDFADEVIKRDLPKIKGMKIEQLSAYYDDKVDETYNAADKFLKDKNIPVDRMEVAKVIQNKIDDLSRNNRIGQDPAIQALSQKRDEILNKQGNLSLVDINQFKRDFQKLAGSAVGGGESVSVISEAYDDVQRGLNDYLESKTPGIKDINKEIQFYKLAKESIQSREATLSKSEGGSILGNLLRTAIPAGAGAAASAASGNPLFALLGGLGAGGAIGYDQLRKSPEIKTRMASMGQNQTKVMPDIIKRLLELSGGRIGSGF